MTRLARINAPGVLHHVIIRGIERRKIFINNKDRDDFLARLAVLLPETRTNCYAWAFMTNHAHFLFQTGNVGLSTLMRRLLTGYVVSFNRRHKRHGQLLQNRYKSIICQEDMYLKELVRYIHLNPLRAKIVSDLSVLNHYPYCGHSVLMGKRKQKWQDVNYVLKYFGATIRGARKEYFLHMQAGMDQGRRPELTGGGLIRSLGGWEAVKKMRLKGQDRIKGDERILGDTDFVNSLLSLAEEKISRKQELKNKGYDIKKVAERVAAIYGMDSRDIMSKGRQQQRVVARSLLCYWSVRELGMSLSELAGLLGMSPPGVGYAVQRGETVARDNDYQLIG